MSWLARRLLFWEGAEQHFMWLESHRYGEEGDSSLDNKTFACVNKTLALQLNRLLLDLKREDFDNQQDMANLLHHVRRYPDCLGMANYPDDEDGFCNVLQHYIDTGKIDSVVNLVRFTVQVSPWYRDFAGGLYLIVDGIAHRLPRDVDVFFPEMIVRSEVPEHVVLDCFVSLEQYFPREKILEYSLLSASCCARFESLFTFFLRIVGYRALLSPKTIKDCLHVRIEDWRYIYEAAEDSTISDYHDIFDDFSGNSDDGDNDDDADIDDDPDGDDYVGNSDEDEIAAIDDDDDFDANWNEPLLIFLCSLGTDYSELVCSSIINVIAPNSVLTSVENLQEILDCIYTSGCNPQQQLAITYYLIRSIPSYFQR